MSVGGLDDPLLVARQAFVQYIFQDVVVELVLGERDDSEPDFPFENGLLELLAVVLVVVLHLPGVLAVVGALSVNGLVVVQCLRRLDDLRVVGEAGEYLVLLHVFHGILLITTGEIVFFVDGDIEFVHFLHDLVDFRGLGGTFGHSRIHAGEIVIDLILTAQGLAQLHRNQV